MYRWLKDVHRKAKAWAGIHKHIFSLFFEIRNLAAEQMGPIMGISCPAIVYPYLRGNVADIVSRAGFPPVHLAEINFQAMYEQQQAEASKTPLQ